MAHSNQVREFLLTATGIELVDVYVGPQGVLTGSARVRQLAEVDATAAGRTADLERQQRAFDR